MNHRPHRPLISLVLAAALLSGCDSSSAALSQTQPTVISPPTLPAQVTQPAGSLSTPFFGPLIDPLLNRLYTATATNTATATSTPTITPTKTALPTFTAIPSSTPTASNTPRPSLTPTPSETPAPSNPAVLFPFKDLDGNTVDWSYARVSEVLWDSAGQPTTLSAFLAFQLLDRGVHRETIQVLDKDLTVYYLNAQHSFLGQVRPVRVPASMYTSVDYYFQKTPSLAALYWPLVALDPLKVVKGPSDYGWALTKSIFKNQPLAETGLPETLTYAGVNLVLVAGE